MRQQKPIIGQRWNLYSENIEIKKKLYTIHRTINGHAEIPKIDVNWIFVLTFHTTLAYEGCSFIKIGVALLQALLSNVKNQKQN